MTLDTQTILDAFSAMSPWEVAAVILGIAYVILAARESVWCWVAAFFSTLIYTVLFWEGNLLSSSMLNFYYMGMAIYGYIVWKRGENPEENLLVTSWPLKKHLLAIVVSILLATLLGYLLSTYTQARLPYLDALVTLFSVLATWMLARKIIETWFYWMVIDSAAIALYWTAGYQATIVLFMLYVILSLYGYNSWRKTQQQ